MDLTHLNVLEIPKDSNESKVIVFYEIFKNEKLIKILEECIDIDVDEILKVKFLDKINAILKKYPLNFDEKNIFKNKLLIF